MKISTQLATTLLALASLPLLAQQQPPANQPPDSPSTQQSPSSTQATSSSQTASPDATATAEMTPVNGELISKLDSKTAKSGDSVVVQTKTSVKTPEGTEIPKGSKLIGHVIDVQPSAAGQTSQVALLLDHVELQGGQSVPVHSQIQSVAPAGGADSSVGSRATSMPPAGGPPNSSASGSSSGANSAPQGATAAPQAATADSGGPPAGTVVAKTGNIDIRTTSVPGVLLANNAPGKQDPRMAQTSSILLGAKQDVHLESGTQMVIAVVAASGGTQ